MLEKNNTGLVVIDIQGKLARLMHESDQLISAVSALIQGAKILGLPILWVEQIPEKLGPTVAELAALLSPLTPIPKYTFGACGASEFARAVSSSGVSNWLICGIETHICVYQTALGLLEAGYGVEVVSDCVSSRSLFNKELAISKLGNKGVEITSVEMCLYELMKDCRAEEFREILKIIK